MECHGPLSVNLNAVPVRLGRSPDLADDADVLQRVRSNDEVYHPVCLPSNMSRYAGCVSRVEHALRNVIEESHDRRRSGETSDLVTETGRKSLQAAGYPS